MSEFEEESSVWTVLNFGITRWLESLLYCKHYSNFNPKHNNEDIIKEHFRVTSKFYNPKSWFSCGINIVLPEIISHYLNLNLSFVTPTHDFDGTFGHLVNETHSTGPLKMMVNNQVDYVVNNAFMSKDLWQPESIVMTHALDELYAINFLMKKQSIRISIRNYLNIFGPFTWMLILTSILVIGTVKGLSLWMRGNDNVKNIIKFTLNLIFNYFNLLISKQPSVLLTKLRSRLFLMYFIPFLSIIVVNSMTFSIYSNMISPPKLWCDSLDCFDKSNLKFYAIKGDASLLLIKNREEFKSIRSRIQLHNGRGKVMLSGQLN